MSPLPLRPNIIYLHSHDSGRYLQPFGHAVPTPRLQRLAEEGVLFRRAFCAAPTCSPSRAALLTGQCAHSSGMLGLAHRGWKLNDYSQHLLHALRNGAGYRAALAGIQHIAARPNGDVADIGFDDVLQRQSNSGEAIARAAAGFLANADKAQPFFLDVGFNETHRVFPAPGPEDDPRWCLPPAPLPDTPETRADMAAFKASARILDASVGIVLDALEAAGLAENTLVISTTDHGLAFPQMKCSLTDHGIGVSLILRGQGGFTGGRVVDGMVSHIDVFPTLCDLLDLPRPDWLQGKSFLPLARGEAEEINEEVFAEVTYHAAYEPQRAIRTQRFKYIRRFDARESIVRPNCDDSPSRALLMKSGWQEQPRPDEMLYDLIFDPNETSNLAYDVSHAATRADLSARLDAWMRRTNDPLLSGPVPLPPGGCANHPDGDLPGETPTVQG